MNFKNNANVLNLTHHKNNFDLETAWLFTTSGHDIGAGDKIGAVRESTARHITLAKIFYFQVFIVSTNFLRKHQLETVKATGRN